MLPCTRSRGLGDVYKRQELDLVATLPLSKKASVQLKYADFQSDGFATDTAKVWFTVNVKL